MTRGSTLIYHFNKITHSRTHLHASGSIRAFSQWPELSDDRMTLLFPITAV